MSRKVAPLNKFIIKLLLLSTGNSYHNPGLANGYLSHGYNEPKGIYTSNPDHMTMQSDSDWRRPDWSPGQ